ncbi:hypothetical protein EDB81DRAFT_948730 [Dactylonectria macrodidyma]|uniref:Uncharacterized protein n=1 Tax=Dactylonectria macrodidyma TaxID=307937 RepID=A0A9P9ENT0_9HYPO|nr:hypothetical protein EDB81DRAFT_948730 [Dactylonectria macrodidyma]
MKFTTVTLAALFAAMAQAATYNNATTTPATTITSQSSTIESTESTDATTDAATNTETGFVQGTSTSDDAGGMPTAGIAMGALMGGAALLVNL